MFRLGAPVAAALGGVLALAATANWMSGCMENMNDSVDDDEHKFKAAGGSILGILLVIISR